MLSENEFTFIAIILIIVIIAIVKLIIDKTINYISGGISFLILIWIISLILNYLGFTMLADFLDFVVSIPTNFVEYLKNNIS
ncbi:MAG: hypothetical protein GQ533_00370 [Methanosarcinaceae archaeon]|nr:hypothetical protein [Methanosarcinaceae archaeon]